MMAFYTNMDPQTRGRKGHNGVKNLLGNSV